jgi:putative nucleotidyltransferase with HDIG domain
VTAIVSSAESRRSPLHKRFEPICEEASLPLSGGRLSLAEILSALSFALDLVEDAKPGHAIRTCLFGMRIADALRLGVSDSADLYYALLLKDMGCSTNARLICQLVGGDDRLIKREAKLKDWTRASFSAVRMMWRHPRQGAGLMERLGRLANMGLHQDQCNAQLIGMRCERGAQIAHKIGLGPATAEAIRCLDEHWDGSGYPDRLVGESIPLLARILNVAQHLDLVAVEQGRDTALDVILERSGRWFDPEIVRVVQSLARQNLLWQDCDSGMERDIVREMEPGHALHADERQIDNISEAFADIVDAKSSFTFQHSLGVTKAALRIAHEMDLSPERKKIIYRASLLHDLGKLRVSNTILDKTTKPDEREWEIIREHPGLTRQILGRIGPFNEIAEIAGNHHEKLDGSGYPLKLAGHDLSLEARILTVADIYGALSEDRPTAKAWVTKRSAPSCPATSPTHWTLIALRHSCVRSTVISLKYSLRRLTNHFLGVPQRMAAGCNRQPPSRSQSLGAPGTTVPSPWKT